MAIAERTNREVILSKPGKFVPSRYQAAIFDALENGSGDIQVQAVAGSGKTSTLVQGLNRLPNNILNDTLVCAFNKEIANELGLRVPRSVSVRTIHSLGLATVSAAVKSGNSKGPEINGNKYRNMITEYWNERAGGEQPPQEVMSACVDLIHFARVTLADYKDAEVLRSLIADYEIEVPKSYEKLIVEELVPFFLTWGAFGREFDPNNPWRSLGGPQNVIDFDDMVWLPWIRGWEPKKFSLVMVDEAQDLNAAQLHLVLAARKLDGRMFFCGDGRQAIYGFCGADHRSWQKIAERTSATQLPLSICYRCPRAVIDRAKQIVPEIECAPDAAVGVVENIRVESFEQLVQPNDMVLCRTNAPLISTAFSLLAEGKRAKVRGRDIGAQMIKLIDKIARRAGVDFLNFADGVSEWARDEMCGLDKKKDNEMKIASIQDRSDSLIALYTAAVGRGARAVADLRAEVQALFVDDGQGYIILSSIHRAKGLEANRVFLLHPELLPHPLAKGDRQNEQESNLQYVAITRAKRELYFVTSKSQ